jgi:starch phosphorylase
MVSEYDKRFYVPAANNRDALLANKSDEAKKLADQIKRLRSLWKGITIDPPVRQTPSPYWVGDSFDVTSVVNLGDLRPDEVEVELYYGYLKSLDELSESRVNPMKVFENQGNGHYLYGCTLTCNSSGRFGFTVRVMPCGDARIKSTPGLFTWA